MNFDAAIRELEEKRDFYDAAIRALKKIAGTDTAKTVKTNGSSQHGNAGRKKSPETIERMRAAQRARHERIKAALDETTLTTPEPELVTQ